MSLNAANAEAAALELVPTNPRQQVVTTAEHTHARDVSVTNRERASECATQHTCSRSYDIGLLTTSLFGGTHPATYVAAIMSDPPLAQAHREAADDAALPVRGCARRGDHVATKGRYRSPQTFRFGKRGPEIESRKFKRIGL